MHQIVESAAEVEPFFSIVMATLNAESVLERCLDSIERQTFRRKELLVIDGGSADGTLSIIRRHAEHIGYWESNPDRGIYHAWNKALERVKGKWIFFLGADDYLWKDDVLENMAPRLNEFERSGVRIAYGRLARVDPDGRTIEIKGKPWPAISRQFAHGMPRHLPHPGMMHHREVFERFGSFDEAFKVAADYELLLRAAKRFEPVFVDDCVVTGSTIGGIAEAFGPRTHLEVARARKKNGMGGVSLFWIAVFLRSILRQGLSRCRARGMHT